MAINSTKIILGQGTNPHFNLALEEHLLDTLKEDECIFYLWQNQHTVVIGKNQNAWRECRTELLEQEGGTLARRSSGGGAVYHDLGNLCFTFITPKADYDLTRQLGVVLNAINSFGLKAYFSGRNDLLLEGCKFSGNAFLQRTNSSLHHGTLLLDVDMPNLSKYLQVSAEKMKAKGVESVRSRVTNLKEHIPGLTLDSMKNALIESFSEEYLTPDILKPSDLDEKIIDTYYQRYSSWEWLYGKTPKFDINLDTRFVWGGIEMGLSLDQGKVTNCHVFSDAMDQAFIENIAPALIGCTFESKALSENIIKIECADDTKDKKQELANWMSKKEF